MFRAANLIACLALAGCSVPSASPPGAALHVENRIATAVVVSFGLLVPAGPDVIVPACGGQVDITPGVDDAPTEDWVITISDDPTGGLDQLLAATGGDPSLMPGVPASVYLMWSTGELQPAALPRWLTITPTGVIEGAAPPADAVSGPCAPWAYPLDTAPPD